MELRRNLKKLRGWFPADPSITVTSRKTAKMSSKKYPPTLRERIVGALGAAGGGLTLMGLFFYFVPNYPKQANLAVIITGVTLLTAAILVRRSYKR